MNRQAGLFQGGGQARAVQAPDSPVRNDGDPVAPGQGSKPGAGFLQKAGAEKDLLGARAEVDGDRADHAVVRACHSPSARMTCSTVTWWGESPVSTVMSASE